MSNSAIARSDSTCSRYDLSHLSDGEVLAGTRRLVGASNQLFADLLAHLAEVEARGIHRAKACASLYTYCIYELRFSEDAAFRRASAARFVKAFRALFEAVASGELHLTGLLLLGPHLTQANQHQVLARAKHRTKKELAKLVRELDPLPDVPARIAPLGPAAPPRTALRNPTWAEYVASMVPVRHLNAGERPADWIDEPTIARAFEQTHNHDTKAANTVEDSMVAETCSNVHRWRGTESLSGIEAAIEPETSSSTRAAYHPETASGAEASTGAQTSREDAYETQHGWAASGTAGERGEPTTPVTAPQRFSVQFTATQQYVDLVERAKALLSHTKEGASLEQLHWRAMQALVTQLEKKKYGAPRRQECSATESKTRPVAEESLDHAGAEESLDRAGAEESLDCMGAKESLDRAGAEESLERAGALGANAERAATVQLAEAVEPEPSRHIPARIRRRVFERDGARCTFLAESGQRCREVERLELHHLKPFARDGQHHADNLTLRCQAHNALAAEQDFGREWITALKHGSSNESRRSQELSRLDSDR